MPAIYYPSAPSSGITSANNNKLGFSIIGKPIATARRIDWIGSSLSYACKTIPGWKLFSTVGPSKNFPTPLDTKITRFSGNSSIVSTSPVYVFLTLAFVFLTIVIDGKPRSEEHTSELQSRGHLVCRLLLEKKISADKWNQLYT